MPSDKNRNRRARQGARPVWQNRELRFRGLLVKRFTRSAPQQERILDAFEEEGWPDTIDNPLPPLRGKTLSDVLDQVVEHLGQRQVNRLLQFTNAGGGRALGWVIRSGAK